MFKVAFEILIKAAMENHLYSFNGDLRRQNKGGAIGNILTGALGVLYTVFWCKDRKERDRPVYCDGFLDWEEVSIGDSTLETVIHNITLPDGGNYQMAIAANTKTHSSGLSITACSSTENNFALFSWPRFSRNYSSVCIVSRLLFRRPEFGLFAGLVWATCTIIKNRVVGKLKEVSVDGVGETTALVR